MTTVEVLVDRAGRTQFVGQAHFTRTRGQISTTFLYDPGYLAGSEVRAPRQTRPAADRVKRT